MLTPAQLATLKAHIAANTATIPAGLGGFAGVQVKDVPLGDDGNLVLAAWYNLEASPAYKCWNPATDIKGIRSALDIAKFTPTDTPPASTNNVTGTNDALLFNNRALKCQLQQANAMWLSQGEGTIDPTGQAIRQSFSDCMTGIPSGASGAAQNAAWGTAAAPGAVRLALQRNANNAEKVYSVQAAGAGSAGNVSGDARGGTTNPDALVFVGSITATDVQAARQLP